MEEYEKNHEMMYWLVLEPKYVNCCDLFIRHKEKNKDIYDISLSLAKDLRCNGYDVLLGWKLCRNCYQRAIDLHDEELVGKLHESEIDYNCEEPLSDNDDPEGAIYVANTNLKIADVSPIRFHGIEKRRKVAVVKE